MERNYVPLRIRWREIIKKRNKAWEAAKTFVETKRDKDGLLSAEDAATYAEMEQKVQNYSAEIARMEEMEAMEAELNKPVNTPLTGKPMNGAGGQEKKTGRASNEYKESIIASNGSTSSLFTGQRI